MTNFHCNRPVGPTAYLRERAKRGPENPMSVICWECWGDGTGSTRDVPCPCCKGSGLEWI